MERYFFDVILNGSREPDKEGVELKDDNAAREEALKVASEFASEPAGREKGIEIRVRRAGKDPVCTVRLQLSIEEAQ